MRSSLFLGRVLALSFVERNPRESLCQSSSTSIMPPERRRRRRRCGILQTSPPGPKKPLSSQRQGLHRPCNFKARNPTPALPSYEVARERGKESGLTVPPRTQRLPPDRSHGSFLPAYYHLVPLPDGRRKIPMSPNPCPRRKDWRSLAPPPKNRDRSPRLHPISKMIAGFESGGLPKKPKKPRLRRLPDVLHPRQQTANAAKSARAKRMPTPVRCASRCRRRREG